MRGTGGCRGAPGVAGRLLRIGLSCAMALSGIGAGAPAAAQAQPQGAPPAGVAAPFQKGYQDAIQCLPSNGLIWCNSEYPPDQYQACVEQYNDGFRQGEAFARGELEQAHRQGYRDGQSCLANQGFNSPLTQGACRTYLVESYNRGYFEGKIECPKKERDAGRKDDLKDAPASKGGGPDLLLPILLGGVGAAAIVVGLGAIPAGCPSCGPAPKGFGSAWYREYSRWCRCMKGTPYNDRRGIGCDGACR